MHKGVHAPKPMMHIALFPQNLQFLPILVQFTFFLPNLRVLTSPYFDHDAIMHHALHVLDASAYANSLE